jgi:hypothetical protein
MKRFETIWSRFFSTAYTQHPEAQEQFSSMSTLELQELAGKYAVAAHNYDPYAKIHNVQGFVSGLHKLVSTVVITIVVVGLVTGAGFWVSLSRGLLDALGTLSQFLVYLLLGGPTLAAIIAGLVLVYAQLLSFNTFIVQMLNQELVIGMADITKRDKRALVGYTIWNSSLNGGSAIKLLAVFSILRLASVTPRFDPYEYVKSLVQQNLDIFAEADGVVDASKQVYRRVRSQEDRDNQLAYKLLKQSNPAYRFSKNPRHTHTGTQ